jgi:anti-anti-sigma factor
VKIETRRDKGVATLLVAGEIDAAEKAAVGKAVEDLIRQGETRLIFDFRRVTYVGSSGMGCLIAARREAVSRQGGVAFVSPPAVLRKMMRTLGVEADFPVYATQDEAIQALTGQAVAAPPASPASPKSL